MKLLRVHIIEARSCGGLLDGLDVWLRGAESDGGFEPLCIIGPNGSGKSQFLQVVAEIFQSILNSAVPNEERSEANPDLQFEIEYLIWAEIDRKATRVRATRKAEGRRKPKLMLEKWTDEGWATCESESEEALTLLPNRIVGYTSGENETLSLPFLVSRSAYADEVGRRAIEQDSSQEPVQDTRLVLIDYGTHLEVLAANLLLGTTEQRKVLLERANLESLHSLRCVVQLNHGAAPKAPARGRTTRKRKGIQLTNELEKYLDYLQRCSTCYQHDERTDTYTFDYYFDAEAERAFRHFWESAIDLYTALHKLAMLNDLAIGKPTRERFKRETRARRFASRLPEPQDEDKVFRFERVAFNSRARDQIVDYVSLSDGEHQLAQLLGTCAMVSSPNVLFLLDEPESHFNPQWRVEFISTVLDMPSKEGRRGDDSSPVSRQDFVLTTHAPFVASDTPRDRVLVFSRNAEVGKIEVRRPEIETFGTSFDAILDECFGVEPPISQVPRDEIAALMASDDPDEIEDGMNRLGHSVDKVFLAHRLRELKKMREA